MAKIKVFLSKGSRKAAKDAIPSPHKNLEWVEPTKKSELPDHADVAFDAGTAATPTRAIMFAARTGCNLVHCLPEGQEQFQEQLAALAAGLRVVTVLDSSLWKVEAQ
jgi:NADPH:quinone reductase-like Zn-dependent oxidoreductase